MLYNYLACLSAVVLCRISVTCPGLVSSSCLSLCVNVSIGYSTSASIVVNNETCGEAAAASLIVCYSSILIPSATCAILIPFNGV